MDLINYIISRPQLEISLVTQDSISHNLGANILCQLGWIFLTVALVLLVPAFLGYVGSVRESRICLIMVSFPVISNILTIVDSDRKYLLELGLDCRIYIGYRNKV